MSVSIHPCPCCHQPTSGSVVTGVPADQAYFNDCAVCLRARLVRTAEGPGFVMSVYATRGELIKDRQAYTRLCQDSDALQPYDPVPSAEPIRGFSA